MYDILLCLGSPHILEVLVSGSLWPFVLRLAVEWSMLGKLVAASLRNLATERSDGGLSAELEGPRSAAHFGVSAPETLRILKEGTRSPTFNFSFSTNSYPFRILFAVCASYYQNYNVCKVWYALDKW